jgi:hypothetical protein
MFDGCRLRPALHLVCHAARLDPSNAGGTDGCAGTAQREHNNADYGFQLSTSTGTYFCPSYLSTCPRRPLSAPLCLSPPSCLSSLSSSRPSCPLLLSSYSALLRYCLQVGYATNADHGFGCSIHPAAKQYCSVRLAHSALAMHYGKKHIAWKSPSYRAATRLATTTTAATDADGAAEGGRGSTVVSVSVQLNDVSAAGLRTVHPANYDPPQYGSNWSRVPSDGQFVAVDCAATFPAAWPNKTKYNASMELQCAWAAVEVGGSWLNATVAIAPGGQSLILTTSVPPTVTATAATATSYGWGPIPMMNIYNKDSDLPVLAWNKTL